MKNVLLCLLLILAATGVIAGLTLCMLRNLELISLAWGWCVAPFAPAAVLLALILYAIGCIARDRWH